MNRIYQITIVEDAENINSDNNDFSHPFFEEIALSLNEKDTNYIGFSDNDEMFVRLNTIKLKRVVDIMKKYFVIEINDVSNKVISGELQKLYPEVESLTPKLFKRFRLDNETVDDVLDKINETGINSLDKVDKKILKSLVLTRLFIYFLVGIYPGGLSLLFAASDAIFPKSDVPSTYMIYVPPLLESLTSK